ncbi:S-layer homology domain-containing protein [Paenibacillus sp. FSL R7-0331]|uniref:S-layer homology domain-containing protein n=1 Tax=Paenibacillus sp. FSL R7-0331 TaxID=1536773 RepID=UPI0018CC8C31|nr:S-layer homology domain-containing protein [Paenibacillus sp. FSL R7-0331]
MKFDGINTVVDPNTGTGSSIFIAKYASDGTLTWVKVIGSVKSASSYGDYGRGIAVDSSGNVYVAAQFMGDGTTGLLDVDPDPNATHTIQGETANSQAFLLKLNSSGVFQWVVTNRGPLSTTPNDAIAINSAGTSVHWGAASSPQSGKSNTVTDGTGAIFTQTATTTTLFVMKINAATGALTWFTANPTTDSSSSNLYSLAVDSSEDVYAVGNVYGAPTFGSKTFENTGTANSFVWKLNSSGVTQWADQFKSSSISHARGVITDSTGVYVTGLFQGTNDFDPGTGTSNATSAGANDVYVVKLNPSDGALLWKFTGGGTGADIGSNLNIDDSGNLYALGTFNGTATFGSTNVTSVGGTDLFVIKLSSSNGSTQWVNTIGSSGGDAAGGIGIYSNGNIKVGATIKGIADVDPSGATLNATNNSGTNSAIALVTWNSSGQLPSGATAPTVITSSSVTGLTSSLATIGGNVTSDGGAAITERGVVYSESANPTISNSKVTTSGTTGTFSINLSALNANTTYHFRAYAKNSQGISYGSDQNFTTSTTNSSISPAIASFDKKTTAQADVTTTMTLNGNTLSSIQNGASTLVLNTDYTVSGSTVTIKKEYLAQQSAGTASLTFTFSAGNTQTLTITVSDTTLTPEATPTAAIDFAVEELTGLTANGTYTVNGTIVTADSNGQIAIDSGWPGTSLSIVKKGNGTTTTDSAAQTLPVPGRPAVPTGVTATDETSMNANNGTLTNVVTTMEYKQGTTGTWTAITGTSVSGLAPDTYYVRVKATSSAFASAPAQVTVGAFTATAEATPAAAIDFAAEKLGGLTANGTYTVNGATVTADSNGQIAIDSGWLGTSLSIVKKGNGTTTTDSAAQTLPVPGRPAVPAGVTATDETSMNANNGTLTNVASTMEYKQGTTGTWTAITGTSVSGLAPDTYYVRVKATSSAFASAPVQVTVEAFTATAEATPAAAIDFAAEKLGGLTANGTYTVNGATVTADSNGQIAIDSGWLGTSLSIVKKGNGTTTTDSAAQTLPVPSRPAAPTGVTATDETAMNANNGTFTNVASTMEYKQGTTGTWTAITGTSVSGLAPDTYYVRVKATSSAFASAPAQVTVGAFTATAEATPAAAIDFAAEKLGGLTANGTYTVNGATVTADSNGQIAIDSGWLGTTLSIVKKGNGTTTTDSAAQTLPVPGRPASPAGVTATDETAMNANNGTLTNVASTMEYKQGTTGTWTAITGTSVSGLAPDTYYVRVKATSSAFASAPVQVAVGAFTATAEATPAAAIDFAAEKLGGLTANGTYTVNGATVTADSNGQIAIDSGWLGTTLSIVKKGNGTTTTDSAAQTLPVPGRPASPAGVTATDETAMNANNGTLTNVASTMEYKQGTTGTWTAITGTSVSGLAPDTYYVRVKATSSAFASAPVQVAVGAFTATAEATPAAAIDFAAEKLGGLTANGTYTVNGATVTADSNGQIAIDSGWLGTTLSIVKKGNGTTTTDSAAQTLPVPGRPASPAGVTATDETAMNANNGTLTNVASTMEYKQGTTGTWTAITGTSVSGLAPDTYYVRVKATSSAFASAPVQVTVEAFTATAEATPAAAIDFAAEKLGGLTANGTYTVNGATVTADSNGQIAIDSGWPGTSLSIVKKGNGTTTTDSAAQTLPVPSRPAAPTGVTATDETAMNANNGTFTNVASTMEYKQGTTGTWTAITGTSVSGLAPHTYYVRVKATSSAFASAPAQVTVGAFTATAEATPAAAIDFAVEKLGGLTANGTYTLNGTIVTADSNGQIAIDSGWPGTSLSIVKKGNGTTTTDSAAQTLPVPGRPAVPAGVTATDETSMNTNNGTLTNVASTMEYKQGTTGTWTAITGTSVSGLAPDTYYVRVKATPTAFASATRSLTVNAFTTSPEMTPATVIDYATEQLTGLTANGSYTVNGTAVTADGNGKLALESSWLGASLSIVKKGNGATTSDSIAQTLSVPARAAAPAGVTVTDVTYKAANNGAINNVTLQMEYRKGSAGPWADVEDTVIANLDPDIYYVRTKATATAFASVALQVTVHDSEAVTPSAPAVTADDQNNVIIGLDTSMEFSVDDQPYVKYDGTNLPDLSGEHTVKVRVAASGSVPAGPSATLTFTADVPVPAGGLTVSASDPSGSANDGKTLVSITPATADGHQLYYKNFGTGNAVTPNVGELLTGYTLVGSDRLIPSANGEKIGIAEVDASGRVVKYGSATAVVTAEPVSIPGGNNGNTGGNTNSGNTSAGTNTVTDVIVLVNGKQENAGTATTTVSGNVKTTIITVDPVKLQAKLDAEGNGAVITIPVTLDSNIFVGELNGQMIKNMENTAATLVLQTNNASYTLPASEINIGALAEALGTGVKLEDIKLKITIGETSAAMNQVIAEAAGRGGFTLVAPSLDFTVTGTYGNRTVEISRFNVYVKRTMAIPDGIDPNRITTGIVIDPDGTVRHVPTRIILKDGQYYAEISSLTNSSYSVVWHPLTFADVANHWAKDEVNDMASRMVINGVNETTFNPNADITRAEFAAIIVRGLGLKLGKGNTAFGDVSPDAWYAGAVEAASEYGLITGFEDGSFRPNDPITREQAMVIIAKAMKLTGLAERTGAADAAELLAGFQDAGSVGSWAKDGLALAFRAGLITGRSGNKLDAKSNVTRAEVAVLIQRLLQHSILTNE